MARDLTRFCAELPAPSVALDAVDPRLGMIGDLASQDQVDRAADLAEEALSEGHLDIRLIVVVLCAGFLEGGLVTLPRVIDAVERSVGENLGAIGPSEKKQSHFDKRITWLFDRIADQLSYHERAATEQWAAWTEGVESETVEQTAASASLLARTLSREAYASSPRAVGRLASALKTRAEAMKAPVAQDTKAVTEAPPPPQTTSRIPDQLESGRATLAVSHEFIDLCHRLRAFEALVQKGRYEKAAVVAADLQRIVGEFDPRRYFPELFSGFAALYSQHIETISRYIDQRESPAWNALDQFYRVDLKTYVDS